MNEPAAGSLLSFPCAFPVKAIGYKTADFEATVLAIVRRHAAAVTPEAVATRDSGGGKFMSVTVTITAASQSQLDALYRELSRSPAVLMVL